MEKKQHFEYGKGKNVAKMIYGAPKFEFVRPKIILRPEIILKPKIILENPSPEIIFYRRGKICDSDVEENPVVEDGMYVDWRGNHCFISSACVRARGLPDDCLELQILRGFRDTYLKGLSEGRRIIGEYYTVAPSIVAAIDRRSDRQDVYSRLFTDLVEPTVGLIRDGKKREAFDLYQRVVRELQGQYTK